MLAGFYKTESLQSSYQDIQDLGYVQKCKVIANVLLWVPLSNDEGQQEKGSKVKQSQVNNHK